MLKKEHFKNSDHRCMVEKCSNSNVHNNKFVYAVNQLIYHAHCASAFRTNANAF